jgi:two-component system response regulator HydG
VVLARGETIEVEHLSLPGSGGSAAGTSGYRPGTPLKEVEQDHILRTLEHCGGNRTEAARQLGIGRNTLIRRLKGTGSS